MNAFFDSVWNSRGGISVCLLTFLIFGLVIQWVAWIFRLGRFSLGGNADQVNNGERDLRFVVVQFFVKLIDDFRHFLALLLVLIFAAVLATAIIRSGAKIEDFVSAVQAVMATLGTLIGSIIGYYFGESAVRGAKKSQPFVNEALQQAPQQAIDAGVRNEESIVPVNAQPPPGQKDK